MPGVKTLTLPIITGWQRLKSIPLIYSLPVLLISLIVGTCVLWFGLATPISYAYSGDSCVSRWTVLPDSQQPVNPTPFSISFHHQITLFNVDLIARQSCFTLREVAEPGVYRFRSSPFANWLMAVRYQVVLPELPKVSVIALNKPIPLTKPVIFALNVPDQTFAYTLQANDRESSCNNEAKALHCQLDDLDLEQGKTYEFAISRYFANQPVETVVEKQTEILRATAVADTTIKPDEMVLAKPTELTIYFDKPIASATAAMYRVDGDGSERLVSEAVVGEQELTLSFAELPREATFEVIVDSLLAQDGSALVEPYVLRFKTSGGPRVSGISIPHVGVALGAKAVINFDQELSPDQDVASLVSVTGGSADIYRSGNSIVVGLSGVAKCADFTIRVDNDIQNKYGVRGNSAWSYNSRTICHTLEVYGYSVKGRPLVAYIFGSSGTAVLFTGAIHGNELSSSYLMDNWISELEANARSLPAGKQIVVIPEVNPDGVARGTRNNANNVDLNRNFAVSDWRSDITDTYGNLIPQGGGSEPMSEPETQALANYTSRLRPRLTMSFHSIGGLVIANQAGDSNSLAGVYARMTGYGNATGQSSQTFDYAISGTYDDWIAEKLGLPSVLVELGSHTYSQFPLNKSALWEMVRK